MDAKTGLVWTLAVGLLLAAAPSSTGTTEGGNQKEYVGSSSQPELLLQTAWCGFTGGPVGIGGACFQVPAGETAADFSINDAVTATPGGWVFFRDADNNLLTPKVHFCRATFSSELPEGTTQIIVQFWDPAYHHKNPLCTATAGTIAIQYT